MRKAKIVHLLVISFFVLLSGAGVVMVRAQDTEQNGFSISPPSFDINANAGDELKNTIKVENISEETIDLSAKTQSFVAYGNEGQIQLTDEESVYSINSWIVFDTPNISISPGQTALFNFTIKVPENAQPGSHFGSIVLSTTTSQTDLNGAKIVQEIGSILLIKLPGDVTESAAITTFKSSQSQFTDPKVVLNSTVKNTGSVIVRPAGSIVIEDIFGNKIQTVEVTAKNILPGSERIFDQEFDFDRVGFFRAKLNLTYGSNQTLSSETTFIALYLQRLVPVLLIILAVIVFYVIFRKRINKAFSVILKG